MTNEAAFLQAILAEPEEDLLRLLFADWLEEQGDPRAEFIRVQCALAHLAEDDPRRGELRNQERVLLAAHEKEWVQPLAGLVRDYSFRRGFVEEISLEVGAFLDHGAELCGQYPIQQIHLETGAGDPVDEEDLRALAASPYLRQVRRLNLASMYLNADAMLVLAASPYLGQLTRLNLNRNVVSDDGVRALAAAPHLEQLTVLELASNLVGDAGVEALAASRGLPRLTILNLRGNSIGDAGVQALAASPLLARLVRLDLGNNLIGDAGAQALAASPHLLPQLSTLDLSSNIIGDRGAQALAARVSRSPFTWLNLRRNYLGQASLKVLALSSNGH